MAEIGPLQFTGFPAFLLWTVVHIAYLIGFANRIVVLTRWAWSFVTHGRGSRLITGEPHLPPIEAPEPPATQTPAEPGSNERDPSLVG